MNDSDYNNYLKKYRNKYKVFKQEDGIYEIKCLPNKANKTICLYSFNDNPEKILLFCWIDSSKKAITNLLKKLDQSGLWFQIHQFGDGEVSIKFKEQDIELFEDIFKIKKRVILSNEEIEKKRLILQHSRKKNPDKFRDKGTILNEKEQSSINRWVK